MSHSTYPSDSAFQVVSDTHAHIFQKKLEDFVQEHWVYGIEYSTTAAKELFDGTLVNVILYSALVHYRD